MKFSFFCLNLLISCLVFGSEPRFENALSLPSRQIQTLLSSGLASKDPVYVKTSLQSVEIFFKDTVPATSKRGSFEKGDGFTGAVDRGLLMHLHKLSQECSAFGDILKTADRSREYIIAGQGNGGALAVLAVHSILNSLKSVSDATEGEIIDIKSNNLIKLIGFYPSSSGDKDFYTSIERSIGTSNCLFFNPPSLFCRTPRFPGIPLEVAYTEYLGDNKWRLGCAFLYASTIPTLIALAVKKRPLAAVPGAIAISTFLIDCLAGSKLTCNTIDSAYSYAVENVQMYGGEMSLYRIGHIPPCSTRRGLFGYLYKKGLTPNKTLSRWI